MIEKETTQDLKMFETNIQAELKIKNERVTSNYEIQVTSIHIFYIYNIPYYCIF